MIIEYLGHSSFYLKDGEHTWLTDPYGPGMGFEPPNRGAEVVTVSHAHPDHNYIEGVPGKVRVLDHAGSFPGFEGDIQGVLSSHGGGKTIPNLIFSGTIGGIKFTHLGDLGEMLKSAQLSSLMPLDVLMIPVGGGFTIGPKEAYAMVYVLKPKVVIPMHFLTARMDRSKVPLKPAEEFAELFPKEKVEYRRDGRLELKPEDLGKLPQVQVMTGIF